MTASEIAETLIKHKGAILLKLTQEDVDVYVFLRSVRNDQKLIHVFQFIFRSYFRLDSVGLNSEFKKKFFVLMAERESDLKSTLTELACIGRQKIQFSFATKLLHMQNSGLPIYDSQVAVVTGLRVMGKTPKERIESCNFIYETLKIHYQNLCANGKVRGIIDDFRTKFKVTQEEVSDTKVIDFLLWALGGKLSWDRTKASE